MDEKMRAAFEKDFPLTSDRNICARVGVDWALTYLRTQQEPIAYQNTINGFIAKTKNAEYQRGVYADPVPPDAELAEREATIATLREAAKALEELTGAIRYTPLGVHSLAKLRDADAALTELKRGT